MIHHKNENLKNYKKVARVLADGRSIVTFLKERKLTPNSLEKYCVVILLEPGHVKARSLDKQEGIINLVEVHANGNGDIDWSFRNLNLLLDKIRDSSVEQIGI